MTSNKAKIDEQKVKGKNRGTTNKSSSSSSKNNEWTKSYSVLNSAMNQRNHEK